MSIRWPGVIINGGDPVRFQVILGAGEPVAVHVRVAF